MKEYRRRSYETLTQLVGRSDIREVSIRVLGSIDDGHHRAGEAP